MTDHTSKMAFGIPHVQYVSDYLYVNYFTHLTNWLVVGYINSIRSSVI